MNEQYDMLDPTDPTISMKQSEFDFEKSTSFSAGVLTTLVIGTVAGCLLFILLSA